jgi:hypothetical protein
MFYRNCLYWLGAFLVISLTACTSNDQTQVTDAAMVPFNDLNLVHAEIPPVLISALKHPYGLPSDSSCEALNGEINELGSVLGPDLDAPDNDNHASLIERGIEKVKSSAVGSIRDTTENVIPFRGWVRKLSGAERYSKRVSAAIAAGSIRRAFLKGVLVSKDCS